VTRDDTLIVWRRYRSRLGIDGSVAVELGIIAPILVILAVGIVDLGNYFNFSQALAAATRIGAEYARDSSVCQASTTGIDVLGGTVHTCCTTGTACPPGTSGTPGITRAMKQSMNYGPTDLTFTAVAACPSGAPSGVMLTCDCGPGVAGTCGTVCGAGGNNRVFIKVTASQAFSPTILPGMPTTICGLTELRIQ
jgi:hypothetical protein